MGYKSPQTATYDPHMALKHDLHIRLGDSHWKDLEWIEQETGMEKSTIVRAAVRKYRHDLEAEKIIRAKRLHRPDADRE